MRSISGWLTIAAVAAVGACGGKKAPEQPAPEPAPAPAPTQPAPAPAPAPAPTPAQPTGPSAEELAAKRERDRATALSQLAALIHFEFDKAEIKEEDRPNLDRKVAILQANPKVQIRISGHADERGSDEYNLALGTRRASAAKGYLVNQGVDAARIAVVSYGEERPLDAGHDEGAWAQNRRDEFEVTAGGDAIVLPR